MGKVDGEMGTFKDRESYKEGPKLPGGLEIQSCGNSFISYLITTL
ncbi:hypothetical protein V7306_23120 [Neobacillus vireti]